jgi:hypothetical protein
LDSAEEKNNDKTNNMEENSNKPLNLDEYEDIILSKDQLDTLSILYYLFSLKNRITA